MTIKKNSSSMITIDARSLESDLWVQPSIESTQLALTTDQLTNYRLYHLTELGKDKATVYRAAMANVISAVNNMDCSVVYVLNGKPEGIELFIGVASDSSDCDIADAGETLKASFEGNFLGAKLETIQRDSILLENLMRNNKHIGLITGVPTFNDYEDKDEDFQSIERLANSLNGEIWQLVIVAKPGDAQIIESLTNQLYDLSTALSEHIKHSVQKSINEGKSYSDAISASESITTGTNYSKTVTKGSGNSVDENISKTKGESSNGSYNSNSTSESTSRSASKNWNKSDSVATGSNDSKGDTKGRTETRGTSSGSSTSLTRERTNKKAEEIQKHVSTTMLERFKQGASKGMFQTAIYVTAESKGIYERLSRGVLSIFQGNKAGMTPLRVNYIQHKAPINLAHLMQIKAEKINQYSPLTLLTHSIALQPDHHSFLPATWLNSEELSLIASLPSKELPGIKLRKTTDFALNGGVVDESMPHLNLGKIIQNGRILKSKNIRIPTHALDKHIFVTGVTGAGKTTTCMTILLESNLPFMVIEPAKTEYRALHDKNVGVEYYTLAREDLTPFRLNPFELVSKKQNLLSHISTLNATFAAVFPMEAAMPYIVEEAIINAYKNKGWDINSGMNYLYDDPWNTSEDVWPILSDMIAELDSVIKSKGMGKEFEEKYRGSLVARLTTLTLGVKGRMLNTKRSLDFDSLLDKKVVIELEELKDEQDKALFMGLILSRLAECMKHRHKITPNFKHLTLVEEAHRLLSKPDVGDDGSKKMGVEMFANMLAEVRKYGEGLIIADQIPSKLISDVIKNTNIKIVHRLFASDDRDIIGDSMGLDDEQKAFLPLLHPGETIMYCGGWHDAVWVKINEDTRTDSDELSEDKISEMGNALIWRQRLQLYPRLGQRQDFNSGDIFKQFTHEGIVMINMVLRLNHNHKRMGKVSNIDVKIQHNFQKYFNKWMNTLNINASQLSILLTELLIDAGTLVKYDEHTLQHMLQYMPSVIEGVSRTVNIFDEIATDDNYKVAGRPYNKILDNRLLGLIDSI